jgi:hypothetical protein
MNFTIECNDTAERMFDTSLEFIRTEATSLFVQLIEMYLHGMYMPQYITEEGPGTREILIGVLGRALSYTHHMYNTKANGRDTDIIPLTPFLAEQDTLMDKPDIRAILLPGCPSISRRGWIFLGKTNEELKQIVDSMFEGAFKEVVERKLQHRQPGSLAWVQPFELEICSPVLSEQIQSAIDARLHPNFPRLFQLPWMTDISNFERVSIPSRDPGASSDPVKRIDPVRDVTWSGLFRNPVKGLWQYIIGFWVRRTT